MGDHHNQRLIDAVKAEDYAKVRKLLDDKIALDIDVNAGDANRRTALHAAVELENPEIVELLLKNDADVNAQNDDGNTPLHEAAMHPYVSIMEMLLRISEADPNRGNNVDSTPFHLILQNGGESSINLFLNYNVDVNAENGQGENALHLAINRCSSSVVEKILKRIENVDLKKGVNDETVLHRLMQSIAVPGDDESVLQKLRLLVNKGAAVDVVNKVSETPLYNAVETRKSIAVVGDLIKAGADVNGYCKLPPLSNDRVEKQVPSKAIMDRTAIYSIDVRYRVGLFAVEMENVDVKKIPLKTAIINRDLEMAKFLLDQGARDFVNEAGKNAVYLAVEDKLDVAFIEYLISKGANVNGGNKKQVPLILALNRKNVQVAELLLSRGAKTDVHDEKGSGIFKIVMDNFHARDPARYRMLDILLKNGADVDQYYEIVDKGRKSSSILQKSIISYDYSLVSFLVERGADVNLATSYCATTPLQRAVIHGFYDAAKILIEHGAKINGFLFDLAIHTGCKDMVELLLDNGVVVTDNDFVTASARGVVVILKLLERRSNKVDLRGSLGNKMLVQAMNCWRINMVNYLIENGVDVNFVDEDNRVPLQYGTPVNTNFSNDDPQYITDPLVRHIQFLMAINELVDQRNIRQIRLNAYTSSFFDRCDVELQRMKETKIFDDFHVTYFDILTKRNIVRFLRCEGVRTVLDGNDYAATFPIYFDYIKRNYQRGIERLNMIELYTEVVYHVFIKKLPMDVIYQICELLNDEELRDCLEKV